MFLMPNKNAPKVRISFGESGIIRRRGLRGGVAVSNGYLTSHEVQGPVCTRMRTKGAHFGAHLGYSTVG